MVKAKVNEKKWQICVHAEPELAREIRHGICLMEQMEFFREGVPGKRINTSEFIRQAVRKFYRGLLREAKRTNGISPEEAQSTHTTLAQMRNRKRIRVCTDLRSDSPNSLKRPANQETYPSQG